MPPVATPGPAGPCGPVLPSAPGSPCGPCGPVLPRGIVKFNTTFVSSPLLVTLAFVPGSPVVVSPTFTLTVPPLVGSTHSVSKLALDFLASTCPVVPPAATPGPVGPCGPGLPRGILKSKFKLSTSPLTFTTASPSSIVSVVVLILTNPKRFFNLHPIAFRISRIVSFSLFTLLGQLFSLGESNTL